MVLLTTVEKKKMGKCGCGTLSERCCLSFMAPPLFENKSHSVSIFRTPFAVNRHYHHRSLQSLKVTASASSLGRGDGGVGGHERRLELLDPLEGFVQFGLSLGAGLSNLPIVNSEKNDE